MAAKLARVEFWYEFASTYSYPAAMRAGRLAEAAGVELVWRPFLLAPIFGAQGWNDSPFNIYPVKGRYMWRDLARICEAEGLALNTPVRFPQNGLKAARLAILGAGEGWAPAFTRAVYEANFARRQDIADDGVLAGILQALGLDPLDVVMRAYAPENKAKLKAQSDEAIAKGIFGAPSFVVDGELFWGNDRLEQALAWAQRRGQS